MLNTILLCLTLATSPLSPEIIATRAEAMGYHNTTYKRALVLSHAIYEASLLFDMPVEVITAVIERETAYQKDQVSTAQCRGPMQLMPKTFKILSKALGMPKANIDETETNILFGSYYLSVLYQKYGRWDAALTAYNRGPGRYDHDRHHRINEYAKKVIDRAKRIEAAQEYYLQSGPKCSSREYEERLDTEPTLTYDSGICSPNSDHQSP